MATLDPILIASFDEALHGVPQQGSRLKDTWRNRMGVVGTTHRFPALGKGRARTRGALQPIQPVTTEKAKPQAQLTNAEDFEFLDIYEMAETNVSAFAGYAKNSRMAVERQCDERGIRAMRTISTEAIGNPLPANNSASQTTAAATIAADGFKAVADQVTVQKLAKALTSLLARGYAVGETITFAYSQRHFEHIAQIDQLLSRDYSERGFLSTGRVPPIYGMDWRGIEDREEGGISPTEGWVYAKSAVGFVSGNVSKMRVTDWRPDLQAFQVGAMLLIGATAIDRNGIQTMQLGGARAAN